MKLPAVAIAVAFAGGIWLGLSRFLSNTADHCPIHALLAVGIFLLLLISSLLAWRSFLWSAAIVSLCAWVGLGILAGLLANQPLPREHVLTRLSKGEIPQKTPLRWRGILRSEPARLPWGFGLETDLTGVESAEGLLPIEGGMRIGYTPRDKDSGLPVLHAGDTISILAEARLPLVYKDAGAFDRREFLARQNIHLLATLRSSALLEKIGTAPPSIRSRIAYFRGLLRDRLDGMFPASPETAAILRAMLLGDRTFVDRTESTDFQKTGVFHVLVVAGLHVGALAFSLFWVAQKTRMPNAVKTLFVVASLFAYVAVVEQRAPVLRAALMAALVIIGSYFYRRLDLLNSAAIAALVLLVANAKLLVDTGFLLSFLAMGAIAGVAIPMLERILQPVLKALENWRDVTRDGRYPPKLVQFRLDFRAAIQTITSGLQVRYAKWIQDLGASGSRLGLRIVEVFLLSLVLQFSMLPMMARDFHRVSLVGPVVNLFAVPLTGVIVPLGFLGLGIAVISTKVAIFFAYPLSQIIRIQARLVSFFADIPHGNYRLPGPPTWVAASFFLLAIAVALYLRLESKNHRRELRLLLILWVTSAVIIATFPFQPHIQAGELEVNVLDVAQGDSILVVSPKGSTLLIDGGGAFEGFRQSEEHLGPDPGEEAVSTYLWSRGFKKLDAVALTHAHQDHIGGLTAILQNFQVRRLLVGRESAAPAFLKLTKIANSIHIPIEHERQPGAFEWDGVKINILWPEVSAEEIAPAAKNNASLVVRLQYGDRTILLPGDAEKQVEARILRENSESFLHADVLKVGHHGSKNSTTSQFLNVVAPQISIISAGEENPYGHPSRELLERLKNADTRIYRTDRDGAVSVVTDGHIIKVTCFEDCSDRGVEAVATNPPDHK